ncbi:MAG: hypothetical protein HN509_14285 [Halobacteriovoraceae bacterium]|jgi:hypothetical protein|nr:hypothetical protein [Halobacteriovoraceae bacterium]MBT5095841.1 hypothetical protein [Halobacteriovoraceae bacterium]
MLKKDIDMALIGKSYLSFILSLKLLDQKKNVLLLDDERFQFGSLFANSLGALEKDFLVTWGEDNDIGPLANLENYLVQKPLLFTFENKRLFLGGQPSRNILEIARKLPFLFKELKKGDFFEHLGESSHDYGPREFDKSFLDYTKRVGQTLYRYKTNQNTGLNTFMGHCPKDLNEYFQHFCQTVNKGVGEAKEDDKGARCLLYMAQAHFQKRFSLQWSSFELLHLFLSLLSPYYELDQDRLLEDLIPFFKRRGGEFKKTYIREWFFHKGKPWSMELASYEGIIHPHKISFLGGSPTGMPLKLAPLAAYYGNIISVFDCDKEAAAKLEGQRIIFCNQNKIGTDFPLWEAEFSNSQLVINYFARQEKGSKIEFYRTQMEKEIRDDLVTIYPHLKDKINLISMNFGQEVLIDDSHGARRHRPGRVPLPRKVHFRDTSRPGNGSKLSNVYYFGPYKEGPLGLLSSLMEIKDVQQFL